MPEIRSATFSDSIHRMSFLPQRQWPQVRVCVCADRSEMSPEMAGNRQQSTYPFCSFTHNLSHIELDTILISISSTRVNPQPEKNYNI